MVYKAPKLHKTNPQTQNHPLPIYTHCHWFCFCPSKTNYSPNPPKNQLLKLSASMGDATTKGSSSIALLQERFRQLQKVKEKREEKELLKMLSESERLSPTGHFDPSNLPFRSNNTVLPQSHRPSTSQDQSLSLGLDLQGKQADVCGMKTQPPSTNLWPNNSTASASFDNSDIDTSLHL